MHKVCIQRDLETLPLPIYLVTLMALYFSPRDTPTEKGGHNYLSLEPIQLLYVLDIIVLIP